MVVEEPAVIAEEPATAAEEPALPAEDPAGVVEKSIKEFFNEAYTKDPIPDNVLGQPRRGQTRSKQLSLAECQEDGNGRLLYRQRLYVPNYMPLKLRLIKDFHEVPAAGHPGWSKTLELLSRQYYWPKMHKDVDRFLHNCHTCQRLRTSRHAPFGILRPLLIPDGGAWCSHLDGLYHRPTMVEWIECHPHRSLPINENAAFHSLSGYLHGGAAC